MRIWEKDEKVVADYNKRNKLREETLISATMSMVVYFVTKGDDQTTAEGKVSELSTEIAPLLYVYTLGNTQPLKDSIQSSSLLFMNQSAKDFIIALL